MNTPKVRAHEWLLAVYFSYTFILALVLPAAPSVRLAISVINPVVLGAYALLVATDSIRRRLLLGVIRDWYPLALMLLAYREMGWFAERHHVAHYEHIWIVWDRVLLERARIHNAIEVLGPVIPALLEIAYSLVYALGPFAVAMLYVYGRRERVGRFLFLFMLAVLLCYVQFPYWPSEPPRTVFPGADFPSYITIFRRFNWWMLGGYGIHTSVFPSAHVAGAFGAAFGMRGALPERRWIGRFLIVMAILIATATVYGRYHYVADAAAGFGMSVVAWAVQSRFRAANLLE